MQLLELCPTCRVYPLMASSSSRVESSGRLLLCWACVLFLSLSGISHISCLSHVLFLASCLADSERFEPPIFRECQLRQRLDSGLVLSQNESQLQLDRPLTLSDGSLVKVRGCALCDRDEALMRRRNEKLDEEAGR